LRDSDIAISGLSWIEREAAMANPTGESESDAVRLDFDRRLMLQFRGSVYNDWLDTDGRRIKWRPFKQARAFVRTLEFKNSREWRAYSKSDERPADIPSDPALVYVDDSWIGSDDWIGKATP
jgi:hypothetical protein